jgi:hypothetical protein
MSRPLRTSAEGVLAGWNLSVERLQADWTHDSGLDTGAIDIGRGGLS